ncbi:uncharacterized protein [Palaemon carinicauda]
MFDGEFKSPKATKATGTVRVPTPRIVVDDPVGGAVLCVEYPDMVQFESAHGNAREAAGRARAMFDGEFKSPKAMKATGTVRVPTPRIVVDDPTGGAVLCLEYRDMAQFESAHGNAREAAGRDFFVRKLQQQLTIEKDVFTVSLQVREPSPNLDSSVRDGACTYGPVIRREEGGTNEESQEYASDVEEECGASADQMDRYGDNAAVIMFQKFIL